MKCGAGSFLSCLCKVVFVLSIVLLMSGCDMWNKDMLGFLEYWTETLQVGQVEVSNATIQKNDDGIDTIPVAATPTITSYIINPQGHALVMDKGDNSASDKSVRISNQDILNLAGSVMGDATMMVVELAAANDSLEHTTFTVNFVPVRSDTMVGSPSSKAVTLQYNTPPAEPIRVNKVVADDGTESYELLSQGALWKAAEDGNLYWAGSYDDTNETSDSYVKWFNVGGVRRDYAACNTGEKLGSRTIFCWDTGNRSVSLAALDGEGVSSKVIVSGQTVPAGVDTVGPGTVTRIEASSGESTVTLTWMNPSASDFSHVVVTSTPSLPANSITVHSQTAGTQGSATITGLTSGTEYTFTFTAYDKVGNGDSDSDTFTWQKLTFDSIAGDGFTKNNQSVDGASGTTLELYWLKDAVISQNEYTAYKPVATAGEFGYWVYSTNETKPTGNITLSNDISFVAVWTSVPASGAAKYLSTQKGDVTLIVKGENIGNQPVRDIGIALDKNSNITSLILDLSGTDFTEIASGAFSINIGTHRELKKIILPNTVTDILSYAFQGCINLEMPTITNVTYIGIGAFRDCKSISGALVIPDTVKTIGEDAFSQTSITSLKLGSSVTSIGEYAFSCQQLKGEVVIPASVTTIDQWAFSNTQITSMKFEGTTPCTISNGSFPSDIPIYVPSSSVDTYKNAWTPISASIANNIQGY